MKFIRVKTNKAVLILTEEEYNRGIDRENEALFDVVEEEL